MNTIIKHIEGAKWFDDPDSDKVFSNPTFNNSVDVSLDAVSEKSKKQKKNERNLITDEKIKELKEKAEELLKADIDKFKIGIFIKI